MLRALFYILFTSALTFSSYAQRYNFKNYSVTDGLSQSQVYSMCQDTFGNIWMATRGGGICRFDGTTFTAFTEDDGLPDNFIRVLMTDRKGNLWIGSDNGISCYDGNKIISYGTKHGLSETGVNALLEDQKGFIWVGTDNGLFRMEKDTFYRAGRKSGIPFAKINHLFQDKEQRIWVGTEEGVFSMDISVNPYRVIHYTTRDGLLTNSIYQTIQDRSGKIWLATYGGGIAQLQGNRFVNFTTKHGLSNNTTFGICLVNDTVMWVATASGITKLNTAADTISVLQYYTEQEGLCNNVIRCILHDRQGNMWMGSSGGGVSRLDSERFVHYLTGSSNGASLVYDVEQDRNGHYWFATSEGGVIEYDGKVYKRYSERNGFTAWKVKCIYEDSSGVLWFGTIGNGLYSYDGNSFRHYNSSNGFQSRFVHDITEDHYGNLWFANAGEGLIVYLKNSERKTFRQYKRKHGLVSDRINMLCVDRNGYLWMANVNGGVSKFQVNEKGTLVRSWHYTNENGLSGMNIRSVIEDSRGAIIIGTAGNGITILYNGRVQILDKTNGLSSNNIYSLLNDSEYSLWVGTEKGIDHVVLNPDYSIRQYKYYGKEEGFTGIETMLNSVYLDRDHAVWFGTIQGATRYDVRFENRSKAAPLLHLTNIRLFFDPVANTSFAGTLQSWFPIPVSLELPYDQNHLSFSFIGVDLKNPSGVLYQWKLEGFDAEWSPLTWRNEAVYSNLPPGNYVFKVRARNEDNVWSEKEIAYEFTIHSPFWASWWFRAAIAVLLILIVYFIFRTRVRALKRKNDRLVMEKNMLELEQKALRLQMNPHFLFNCLNSIKGLIAEQKLTEAKTYLSKFAKLMRAILDNSRETYISLEQEIQTLHTYAELEDLSREKHFEFKIETTPELDITQVKIPPMIVQPFVENAILHGISNLPVQGKITVRFIPKDSYIQCEVEDNGVGRAVAQSHQQHSLHRHRPAAVQLTQERLAMLNDQPLSLEIIDLKEGEKALGTKVILKIPYIN